MTVAEVIEWLKTQDQTAIVRALVQYDKGQDAYFCSEDLGSMDCPLPEVENGWDGKKVLLFGELGG